jgi:DNA mismatch repair protein MutL
MATVIGALGIDRQTQNRGRSESEARATKTAMPRIQVLPPGLVNQIAAGEVVERPASVVKELVENALDAGARTVSVDIEEGGLALVRVADDGCGMDQPDAVLALERHATSKLRDAAGLAAISTMGFRGEALPAIASVSRLRLDTAAAEDGHGNRVDVEAGVVRVIGALGRPRGTTVEVRDLFFNTPARRKFMRAPAAEAGHVTEAVVRLALARTDVSFTLRSGGRIAFGARGGEPLPERAAQALGREAHRHLVAVDAEHGDIRVRGVVCSPDHSEATARALYLFVNGRWVLDRSAAHAVLRAFAGALPAGRHPAGILFVELPPGRVDVNVHPQKHEVRFADPRGVQDALFRAVSAALRTAPWLGRSSGARADRGEADPQWEGPPRAAEEAAGVLAWARAARPPEGSGGSFSLPEPVDGASGLLPQRYFESLRYVGQHARTYLLCEAPGGALVIVDQHASHERLLFHGLREAFRSRPLPVQPFLLPQIVTVPPAAARALEAGLPELRRLGLDVEPFGGDAFAVKGAPAALGGADLAALLGDLAGQLAEVERGSALDDAFHDLLATIACHAAVRANQEVSPEEARALLDGLDAVDFKARCPHGRPVVFELQPSELERRVGRR